MINIAFKRYLLVIVYLPLTLLSACGEYEQGDNLDTPEMEIHTISFYDDNNGIRQSKTKTLAENSTYSVYISIRNFGFGISDKTTFYLYQSDDKKFIKNQEIIVTSTNIDSIAREEVKTYQLSIKTPNNGKQTIYYGGCIDQVHTKDELWNNCSSTREEQNYLQNYVTAHIVPICQSGMIIEINDSCYIQIGDGQDTLFTVYANQACAFGCTGMGFDLVLTDKKFHFKATKQKNGTWLIEKSI